MTCGKPGGLTGFGLVPAIPPDIVFPGAVEVGTNDEAEEPMPASWLVRVVPVAGGPVGPNRAPAVALVTARPKRALLDDDGPEGPKT